VALRAAFFALLFFALSFRAFSSATCIPFDQAQKHIGETQCVSGKVLRVEAGSGGVHYLDFCEDHGSCSFSVVVFASDLKRIGDVDQLAGKTVEIRGEVKEYDGRAEMVLDDAKQLGGEAPRLPPFQKNFDVEQRGHFSAGQSRASKKRAKTKKSTATLPIAVPEDAESD
jgi:DNA/RNA endonuclease YhcR with UshA esterase domain